MATRSLQMVPSGPAATALPDMPSAQIPWNRRGLCVNAEPDAMFVTGAAQREAARLCAGCPVRMECLADSLDNRIEFGVWGGMTERQRRALLKERPDVYSWLAVLQEAREAAVRSAAS